MDNFRGASTLPQQDDGLEAAKKARADLSTREANRRSLQAIHDTPAAGIRVMRHERTRNKYEDRNSEDKDPSEMTSEDRAMHLLEPVGSGGLPGKVGIVTKQAYKTMNVVSAPIPR